MEEKEKADALLRLLNGQLDHLKQTREIEFKVNIALWTAIVVGGGFLYGKVRLDTCSHLVVYAVVALIILIVHFVFWLLPVWNSEATDNHFILQYRHQVENLCAFKPNEPPEKLPRWISGFWWALFEAGMTLALLVAVGFVLAVDP